MTRPLKIALITVAILTLSPAVFADSIVGTGGWQDWSATILHAASFQSGVPIGTPYWNNGSQDGASKNIGYCISGTGLCGMPDAPGLRLPYWGVSGGTADSSFSLTRSSASGDNVALKIEIAGNSGTNKFGWYDTLDPTHYDLNVIFNGPASAGDATVYIPTQSYGFWLKGDQGTYFTDSSLNTSAAGTQHFAVFQQTAGQVYWLGMEDRHSGSDYDYNDMVVKISSTTVPDGGMTLILLGGALVGLETLRRRFRA
jgi:hypothetical protein